MLANSRRGSAGTALTLTTAVTTIGLTFARIALVMMIVPMILIMIMIMGRLRRTPAVVRVRLRTGLALPQFTLMRGCVASLRSVPTAPTATATATAAAATSSPATAT